MLNTNTNHVGRGHGGGGGGVDVHAIPGMVFSYDFELTNTTVDSGRVQTMTDLSPAGNHRDYSASLGLRPLWYADGGINGKPYSKVDTGRTLYGLGITTSPFSFYMVIRIPILVDNNRIVSFMGATTNGQNGVNTNAPGSDITIYNGVAQSANLATAYNNGWQVIRVVVKNATASNSVLRRNLDPHYDISPGGEATNYSITPGLAFGDPYGAMANLEVAAYMGFTRTLEIAEDLAVMKHYMTKFAIPNPTGIMAFGDSHTVGTQSGTPGTAYIKQVATATDKPLFNLAINGTVIRFITPQGSNEFEQVHQNFIRSIWNHHRVHAQYGTNDATYHNGVLGVPFPDLKASLKEYLQNFIDVGFDNAKIDLSTVPYSTHAYVVDWDDEIAVLQREVGDELDTNVIDYQATMIAAGIDAATVPGGDGIHFGATGHNHMADEYLETLDLTGFELVKSTHGVSPTGNNYSGRQGIEFTVGAKAIQVTHLSRYVSTGNTGVIPVKISNAANVTQGSANLDFTGATAGTWVELSVTPFTLAANTKYYLQADEVMGQVWEGNFHIVVPTNVHTIFAIFEENGVDFTRGQANMTFGRVSMKYNVIV